jgi:hypothetical protein
MLPSEGEFWRRRGERSRWYTTLLLCGERGRDSCRDIAGALYKCGSRGWETVWNVASSRDPAKKEGRRSVSSCETVVEGVSVSRADCCSRACKCI